MTWSPRFPTRDLHVVLDDLNIHKNAAAPTLAHPTTRASTFTTRRRMRRGSI